MRTDLQRLLPQALENLDLALAILADVFVKRHDW
jgi:hypothetical protein